MTGLLFAGLVVPVASDAAVSSWETVVLEPLSPGESTRVGAVNNAGISVGSSGTTPVRWDVAGSPTALSVPAGCTRGDGRRISEGGVVLGAVTCGGHARSVHWLANGTAVDHPAGFFGLDYDDASGILVGSMTPGDGTAHAAAYQPGSPIIDLADGDAGDSFARAMQADGYVVGTLLTAPSSGNPGYQVAAGWYGPWAFPLVRTDIRSAAVDVNEAGFALVQVSEPGYNRGVLVAPGGRLIAIENGGVADDVVDLNNNGAVVGYRSTGSTAVGLIYVGGGSARLDELASPADATALGFHSPVSINDNAWVVGNLRSDQGVYTAWLLRPPTT